MQKTSRFGFFRPPFRISGKVVEIGRTTTVGGSAFFDHLFAHIQEKFRLQWMNLAKPTFALGLSGPAGIPRVPDPLGQDEARLHVDADALSYLEPVMIDDRFDDR